MATTQEGESEIRFQRHCDGISVVDPIESYQYVLGTPERVAPEPADTTVFRYPVDAAVSIRTESISLPSVISVHVRDETGATLCKAEHFADEELAAGQYIIELSATVKLYLHVESSVTVSADDEEMCIDFGERTEVLVGARSPHDRPATTVTTTTDPEDMIRAISTFGSALKTTSPERSYPTLRGHPPAVELGESVDLAGLEPPETGITIEIPPEYRSVFVVAPLAYYLGATVESGAKPLMRTDDGFEYSLDGPVGFEQTVERTLKQAFFLDCLTRTEGLSPGGLHERRAVETDLGLDFAALYDCSLTEQLEAYLQVPFSLLAAHVPDWKLTSHVEPTASSVEMLPYIVSDLAVVRSAQAEQISVSSVPKAALGEYLRDGSTQTGSGSARASDESLYVRPERSDALEQAWVGEGTPLGASKATVEAYRNRFKRTPTDENISITVVCNDTEMDEERGLVDDIYGDRPKLPFDITVERDLTTAELEAVLSTQTEFLHYVGHVNSEGFECVDGKLDAATLESVGVEAFLLNACQSYRQGMNLIERGAIAGIVTLSDVLNRDAIPMGQTFAGLLNCGFPLRAALEIARNENVSGGQYAVIGDGGFAIAQAESGTPNLCKVECVDNGGAATYRIEQRAYPTNESELGSVFSSYVDAENEYHISSGTIQTFELKETELEQFLELETIPVKIGDSLRWSDRLNVEEIRDLAKQEES